MKGTGFSPYVASHIEGFYPLREGSVLSPEGTAENSRGR